MSIGPLSNVGTQVTAINLDVSRQLNWGNGLVMEFIVVDPVQLSKWRTVQALTRGFDRAVDSEETNREGSQVIFEVADLQGNLGDILRLNNLHIRVDGTIYRVEKVPPLASSEAQVYTITCKTRTVRTSGGFDNTK